MQALVDGVAEHRPAERGRRTEDSDIPWLQAVHSFAVCVKPDELPLLRHVHLGGEAAAQAPVAVTDFRRVDIRHGDELDGSVLDAECILGGAGAASAASHESKLNCVVLLRM